MSYVAFAAYAQRMKAPPGVRTQRYLTEDRDDGLWTVCGVHGCGFAVGWEPLGSQMATDAVMCHFKITHQRGDLRK